jgi:inorganic pyrophosphatase
MAKGNRGLQEPTKLKTVVSDTGLFQVIIENTQRQPQQIRLRPRSADFLVEKGTAGGHGGFMPRTLADDGDPLDVLLLMDEPAFPGTAVQARLIGVIEGEQVDGKKRIRNDRIVAVANANHMYVDIKKLDDLPKRFVKELEEFFVNYHRLEGKEYRLLGCRSARTAQKLIEKASK